MPFATAEKRLAGIIMTWVMRQDHDSPIMARSSWQGTEEGCAPARHPILSGVSVSEGTMTVTDAGQTKGRAVVSRRRR